MSQQTINIGSAPNDGTGDPLRTAFTKCNSNFTELYTAVSPSSTVTSFNTRVGAITLSSLDVTNALTYTPLNKAGDNATGLMVFSSGFTSNALSYVTFNTGSLGALPGPATGTVFRAINVDGTATRLDVDSFVNAGNPTSGLTMRGARGTGTVPAAVQSGDLFGSVSAHGYGATSFQSSSTGLIGFYADSATFSDTSQPTGISFQVTPSASTAKAEKMRLDSNGVLTIESTTDSTTNTTGTLVVSGGVGIAKTLNVGLALNVNANVLAIGGQPAAPAGTIARLVNADTTNTRLIVDAYVNSATPTANVTVRGSRGSAASPAPLQSGDVFGSFNAFGYGNTGYAAASVGAIHFITEGLFSDASQATALSFQVTPSGSVTKAEQMRLTSAGVLTLSAGIASTTTTSGTVVVTGGVGVSGAMNVGGTLTAANLNTSGHLAAKAPVTVAASTYTQLATDFSLIFNFATAVTVTLLSPSTVPGQILYVKSIGAGAVGSASSNVVLLAGSSGQATILSASGKFAMLQSDGTNWIVMMSN
jgi:hypothetical protein